MKTVKWIDKPISPTCEVLRGKGFCDAPTTHAYPAMGGGWMALCFKHAGPHLPQAPPIDELIRSGHKFL